ncbi:MULTISPECIES: hypothetical protein [unclassified Bacteroides]|jgi:hypothetical protein|uniref:hypothetical protein n=1 Tax=unclassified Bacteroides TaxID=2646097 RepID=UPI000E9A8D36|nr:MULTISPECIES: hypothetical protein [unclassified Bacteroides]RGN42895.1 hypothetical protein DXB63_16255 [Bacteroides sp. OM05-12]RHR70350.1 hypothetical protein DWW69_18385 [Bacteroides sp. AF16-49]
MKALLPAYCRLLGYAILLLSIFSPFILMMYGIITDENLLLCKEIIKLFMIVGLLMILLAYTKNENEETEVIRVKAMRNAFFITIIYIFVSMLFRLYKGSNELMDTSSFLIFMAMNVICLEFGIKKAVVDKIFKR